MDVGCVPVHYQTGTIPNELTKNILMIGPKGAYVVIVKIYQHIPVKLILESGGQLRWNLL